MNNMVVDIIRRKGGNLRELSTARIHIRLGVSAVSALPLA